MKISDRFEVENQLISYIILMVMVMVMSKQGYEAYVHKEE